MSLITSFALVLVAADPPAAAPPPIVVESLDVRSLPGRTVFEPGRPVVVQPLDRLHSPVPVPRDPLRGEVPTPAPKRPSAEDDSPGYHAVWNDPAHFAQPDYGLDGMPVPRGAAVLYEGMSLVVHEGGQYELRYVVEAPRTPVTIHLQLQVTVEEVLVGTVTLPPVTLRHDNDFPNPVRSGGLPPRIPTRTWQVRSTGYSPVLRKLSGQNRVGMAVTRVGAARFGSLPE